MAGDIDCARTHDASEPDGTRRWRRHARQQPRAAAGTRLSSHEMPAGTPSHTIKLIVLMGTCMHRNVGASVVYSEQHNALSLAARTFITLTAAMA